MPGLDRFSFAELWSPFFLFAVIAVGILYFYVIGPWRLKHVSDAPPVRTGQKIWVVLALTLFYLAQGGPLELMGHLSFTYHMVNMSISYLIVPPMILLGVPAFIWRKLFGRPGFARLGWLMHPLLSLILFNALFSLYHVPMVHDYVMTHYTVHRLYYVVLLVTSFMMWWQIVCPVPEWNRLTDVRKMGYVFANGILLTPACALIIFAGSAMYATYNDPQAWAKAMGYCVSGSPDMLLSQWGGPAAFSLMSPKEDQQLGGIVMKLVQEFMYGAILAYIFFHWYRREHGDSETELPPGAEPAGAGS